MDWHVDVSSLFLFLFRLGVDRVLFFRLCVGHFFFICLFVSSNESESESPGEVSSSKDHSDDAGLMDDGNEVIASGCNGENMGSPRDDRGRFNPVTHREIAEFQGPLDYDVIRSVLPREHQLEGTPWVTCGELFGRYYGNRVCMSVRWRGTQGHSGRARIFSRKPTQ